MSYLSTTQNSLPVAGQALLNGIRTRKVPMKGFKVVDYISFPFPKLAWRNCIDRPQFLAPLSRSGEGDRCAKRNTAYLFRYAHPAVRWRGRDMPQLNPNAVFTWRISTNDGLQHSRPGCADDPQVRSWQVTKAEPSER